MANQEKKSSSSTAKPQMDRQDVQFDRWVAFERSTWPFQIFKKYNLELERMHFVCVR